MFFIPICAASDSGGMEFVMKHNIVKFKDCCEQRTKVLAKLIREDVVFFQHG